LFVLIVLIISSYFVSICSLGISTLVVEIDDNDYNYEINYNDDKDNTNIG